ncbi:MAG: phosphate regulon transcriptional regulatory protein PhoB [Gammaproteobacteria bacterium]|nr:phosphate regulon transcriptional regulatory protein PhoB [Gammaproteobacteria bacterium]
MNHKILIVEDERPVREMIRFALERTGFEIQEAPDGHQALAMATDNTPDLILLDWMLPDLSGIELARRFRKDGHTQDIPIIMLTARAEEDDKIVGLDAGADDYVTKPFSPRELIARIKAVIRRSSATANGEPITHKGLSLDPESHRVLANDDPVEIGPTEFRLLQFFMAHPERVYSRGQLLDRVWGSNVYIEERTVDVHIRRLRKCLAPYGYDSFIQTVHSVGYRFSSQG